MKNIYKNRKKLLIIYIIFNLILLNPCNAISINYSKNTSLTKISDYIIGENLKDEFGRSCELRGDYNNDGIPDIVIGSGWNKPYGTDIGKAYLLLNNDKKSHPGKINATNGTIEFTGIPDEYASYNLASGDLNGDGIDDLIISAHANSDMVDSSGKVYIFYGRIDFTKTNYSTTEADAVIYGTEAFAKVGWSISSDGDLNGDGYDDLVIGYEHQLSTRTESKVRVILGKNGGLSGAHSIDSIGIEINDTDSMINTGGEVSIVGDVNGDGYDDLFITSRLLSSSGQTGYSANLFFGETDKWLANMTIDDYDVRFTGKDWTEIRLQRAAGDIDRDGYDDIILGLPYGLGQAQGLGTSFLFFGRSQWKSIYDENSANVTFKAEQKDDDFAYQLTISKDVNGDNIDDILISASFYNNSGEQRAGKAYLFLGRARSDWSSLMDPVNSDASFIGELDNSTAGTSICGADIDGNGLAEILIGAASLRPDTSGRIYLIHLVNSTPPRSASTLKFYSDRYLTKAIDSAWIGDRVYVELNATDLDLKQKDMATINITSRDQDKFGIKIHLQEDEVNSGHFIGSFQIMNISNEDHGWIGSKNGDRITGNYFYDPSVIATLDIKELWLVVPMDHDRAKEDSKYSVTFGYKGIQPDKWTYSSNATWLRWDASTHTLSGTPNNLNIGYYSVTVGISYKAIHNDTFSYRLTVLNNPPHIMNQDITSVLEDKTYHVDYSSDDDGQGNITWTLSSQKGWLSINRTSGLLYGTPSEKDVGDQWVNVSVFDGNGGSDHHNFTLIVEEVNDAPIITVGKVPLAFEDSNYHFHINATDEENDSLTWELKTDEDWLTLNDSDLHGIPNNQNVGECWANITVIDTANNTANVNITIIVINVPPNIMTRPITTTMEEQEYSVYFRSDDDGEGNISWELTTNASWLKLDYSSGHLYGKPGNPEVGQWAVNVSVFDGNGGQCSTNFVLTVININDPPIILSDPVRNATVDLKYEYDVKAFDIDKGDILRYSILIGPKNMKIEATTGQIIWTPSQGQEGIWEVRIGVSDSNITIIQIYNITVQPHLIVTIIYPSPGQRTSGLLIIRGNATGPNGTRIKIKIDGRDWVDIGESRNWTYSLDTARIQNGDHMIYVQSDWGKYKSDIISKNFSIDNQSTNANNDFYPILFLIFILISIILIVLNEHFRLRS